MNTPPAESHRVRKATWESESLVLRLRLASNAMATPQNTMRKSEKPADSFFPPWCFRSTPVRQCSIGSVSDALFKKILHSLMTVDSRRSI